MRINKLAQFAVVSGAAASVALATAAPALAHGTSGGGGQPGMTRTPTLAQQQAWLDSYLARSQQRLAELASKVAADPNLTSTQKSNWASWIAQQQAALTQLKAAVDAATTETALQQAVHSSMAADGWFGRCGYLGAEHWFGWHPAGPPADPAADQARAAALARAKTAHAQTEHAQPTRTVVLRTPTGAGSTAGLHRSEATPAWNRDYQPRHSGSFGGSWSGGSWSGGSRSGGWTGGDSHWSTGGRHR